MISSNLIISTTWSGLASEAAREKRGWNAAQCAALRSDIRNVMIDYDEGVIGAKDFPWEWPEEKLSAYIERRMGAWSLRPATVDSIAAEAGLICHE